MSTVPGRRILVVAYAFPPAPFVGGNRWLAIRDHLRARGHEVTVLTTTAFGTLDDDAAQDVHRTSDLIASGGLRRLLRRPAVPVAGGPASTASAAPAFATQVLVPDAHLASWVPFALRAARRLLGERRYDAIVTTTPYESAHLVGLAHRGRVAWIADFRDGWVYESHRPPFPTAAQRSLDRRMERRVVRAADVVLAATRPIVEDFRTRLGVDAVHVTNGWDPAWEAQSAAADAPPLEPGCVNLVHTGTLSGARGRDPRPLLRALRVVAGEPAVAARLRLILAGRPTQDDDRILGELGSPLVRHVGMLSRPAAHALQRQAGGLVLLTGPDVCEATGKLFEYIGARRPVLALAAGNEAERIVSETGIGRTVARDDEGAIAALLREVAAGALERAYDPRGLDEYIYPAPALKVEQQIERAIARRGRR
ncbi:MAG: glycosyltransferase [Actinobacteria bacterium]|nr:glycosyltransferase [Actinomycetota bacterium]